MSNKKIANKDTVFIIGSGPSLNEIDISKLAGHNTISLNRQYIAYSDWGFIPAYYMIIDKRLISTIHKDIEKLIKEEKGIKEFLIMNHPNSDYDKWLNKVKKEEGTRISRIKGGGGTKFTNLTYSSRLGNFPEGKTFGFCGNAGACAVDVARFLGYKKVVLLGVDANYVSRSESVKAKKDLSHFHPKYFDVDTFKEGVNQGSDSHKSKTYYWEIIAKEHKKIKDFEIISSSPNSPINNFFKYIDFKDLV